MSPSPSPTASEAERQASESAGERRWAAIIGFFVDNKLVVLLLAALLAVAGLVYAPFPWDLGPLPREPIAVDALPDTGENQQIVFTEWPGRSPRDVEDQITYPLTSALLGVAHVETVRAISMFGFSSVHVIFADEADFYSSRSRVLEKLASLPAGTLPPGVTPTLGPDATGLGQVFWYTLQPQDEAGAVVPGAFSLDELRSIQDWNVRFALQSVPGIAEVSSVGGMVREYQVDVDPQAMLAAQVSLGEIADAVRRANLDVGARTIEINGAEYLIRGLGFIKEPADLEEVVVATREHTPIRVKDVARVGYGPALRSGVLDVGGAEAVGGVVVVRHGENALQAIDRVKAKIAEIGPGLPRREVDGRAAQVKVVPFYDRSGLILETLGTLSSALIQQVLITVAVILVILRHLPSSILVSMILPLGVLGSFVLMRLFGVDANVMALGGIAIAIGTMVDVGIVFVENIVQHLDEAPEGEDRGSTVRRAAAEVAAPVMTSITTTVLAFLPIFGLTGAEGRLFAPLAYTKTFALVAAFAVALVILPPLAHLLLRRRHGGAPGRRRLLDLAVAGLGVALIAAGRPGLGALLALVAAVRLAEPLLPARRRWLSPAIASAILGAAVMVALVRAWMPLGAGHGLADNLLFLVVILGPLAGLFLLFHRVYRPLLALCLEHKVIFLALNLAIVFLGASAWLGGERVLSWLPGQVSEASLARAHARAFPGLRGELMPPFDEGTFLFMPTTTPHASIGEAAAMLAEMDASIAAIPEVTRVVGKIGRAESALDPAPLSMFEVVVDYRPEFARGPGGEVATYRVDPATGEHLRGEGGALIADPEGRPFRQWRPEIRGPDDLWREIARVGQVPGVTGAPKLMPIKTRLVMLQTGMRAAIGVKIRGDDLEAIEAFGLRLEALLRGVPEVAPQSVVADRIVGKPYLEIELDRPAIAREGLGVVDVQDVIQVAVGGEPLTRTVEGRERYPVRVRYMREERDSVEALTRILVPTPRGEQVPLGQLAQIRYVRGPQMIRAEDTFLTGYVTFDAAAGVGEIEAAEAAKARIDAAIAGGELTIPEGVSLRLAGAYEDQQRTTRRLLILVPLALAITFILMYLQFRRVGSTLLVFSGSLISASGGMLLLWLWGQEWFLAVSPLGFDLQAIFQTGEVRVTVAVWVGFLALFGVDTDNGVIMATYLGQRFRGAAPADVATVRALVIEAAERRVRPCLMTTATTLFALLPVLTSRGRGADLMIPMALPVVGGISLALVTLLTVPVVFASARELELRRRPPARG